MKLTKSENLSEPKIINIGDKPYKCYNLYRSAILMRNTIMIDVDGILEVIKHDSDLEAFKKYVLHNDITLSDLGILKEVSKVEDYYISELSNLHGFEESEVLKLMDIMPRTGRYFLNQELKFIKSKNQTIQQHMESVEKHRIEVIKSQYKNVGKYELIFEHYDKDYWVNLCYIKGGDYHIDISFNKLGRYLKDSESLRITELQAKQLCFKEAVNWVKGKIIDYPNIKELKEFLNILQTKKQEIMIDEDSPLKFDITSPEHVTLRQKRIARLGKIGFQYEESTDTFVRGFDRVAMSSVQEYSPKEWSERMKELNPLPVSNEVVSLSVIGSLQPNSIEELKGLEQKQLEIVKEYPFIAITDKKTLKQAKEYKAALLKASTAIDSPKEGILSGAKKYLKAISDTVVGSLTASAKITRDAHEKQAAEITRYENEEAERTRKEQEAATIKINERTELLLNSGFVRDNIGFNIGTVYVMPSQIQSLEDEEFNALVERGKELKVTLDKVKSDTDKELEELRARLAKYEPPVEVREVDGLQQTVIHDAEPPKQPIKPTPEKDYPYGYEPESVFNPALTGNITLEGFDKAHEKYINMQPIPEAFIKCRAYAIIGSASLAVDIMNIMNAPAGEVPKSKQIIDLCKIVTEQYYGSGN